MRQPKSHQASQVAKVTVAKFASCPSFIITARGCLKNERVKFSWIEVSSARLHIPCWWPNKLTTKSVYETNSLEATTPPHTTYVPASNVPTVLKSGLRNLHSA